MPMHEEPSGWLEQVLQAAEALLGVRVTVYDLSGLFHDARGRPLLDPARRSHRAAPACGRGFRRERCMAHCMRRVGRRAAEEDAPFVHRCWKGLAEVVVPLRRNGRHAATLFIGPWRTDAADGNAAGLWARKAIAALPAEDTLHLHRVAALAAELGRGLLTRLDHADRGEPPETRTEIVRGFLRYRACGSVRLADLARHLGLSPSRTSHVVSDLFGCSFRELLAEARIRRACVMLHATDLTVREIAARVGIPNEYHFNRLFRSRRGCPPGAWRKRGLTEACTA